MTKRNDRKTAGDLLLESKMQDLINQVSEDKSFMTIHKKEKEQDGEIFFDEETNKIEISKIENNINENDFDPDVYFSSDQFTDKGKTEIQQSNKKKTDVEPQVSVGQKKSLTNLDLKFGQTEAIKYSQKRINELEQDLERIRRDSEVYSAAAELAKSQVEILMNKVQDLDRVNNELRKANENELQMFKESLQQRDSLKNKLQTKVEELETRLSQDMRRIRIRERELENRLELVRLEKNALVRAKDETILDLKKKNDNLEAEIEGYKNKITELQNRIEGNQEQFGRTVRALRLALTNLESSGDETDANAPIAALKKVD